MELNQFYKNLALWLVIGLIMIALFNIFNKPHTPYKDVIYSDFVNAVEKGEVAEVSIQGDTITGKLLDNKIFRTLTPKDTELIKILREKRVSISVAPPDHESWLTNLLISWFPMILLLGIWLFFMRQMQMGGGKALSFGKAKVRLLSDKKNKETFNI